MFEANLGAQAFGFLIGFTARVFCALVVWTVRLVVLLAVKVGPVLWHLLVDQPGVLLVGAFAAVTEGRVHGWEWPDSPITKGVVVVLLALTGVGLLAHHEKTKAPKHFRPGKIHRDGWVYERKAEQFTKAERRRWQRQLERQAKPPSKATTAARKAAAKAQRVQEKVDALVAVPVQPPLDFPELGDTHRERRKNALLTWWRPAPNGQDPLPLAETTRAHQDGLLNELRTWHPTPPTKKESN